MSYKFVYENGRGEKLNLCELPYWLNVEPIFDYSWDYTKREHRRGDIIAGFTKTIQTTKLVLHIMGDSTAVRNQAIDRFNSIVEYDIYNGSPGKITIGDWYTYGYITASNNEKWQYEKPVIKKSITLAREQDSWYRQTVKKSYESNPYVPSVESWTKNYEPNYDYQYDYMVDFGTSVELVNPDDLPSNFILSIQGYANQPEVHIGDKIIQFNVEVPDGAVLVVDATKKTTTMYMPDGTEVNVFGARNADYYIFERIASGKNAVVWDGAFDWEITLFEERSEPRWLTV